LSREEVEKQLSEMLASVNAKLQKHERIEFIILSDVEWNEANGLCTHSMKIKRANVEDKYKGVIGELYPSMQGSDSVVYWQ
jgi:long-chain acyl-CoA synthetase